MGDWVVQDESWHDISVTQGHQSIELGLDTFNTHLLTSWMPAVGNNTGSVQRYRFREASSQLRAVAVRGHLHWWMHPFPGAPWSLIWGEEWVSLFSVRVSVTGQNLQGAPTPAILPEYDISGTANANEPFVYHKSHVMHNVAASDWNGTPASRVRTHFTLPFSLKFRRNIDQAECLVLHASWEQHLEDEGGRTYTDMSELMISDYTLRARTYLL